MGIVWTELSFCAICTSLCEIGVGLFHILNETEGLTNSSHENNSMHPMKIAGCVRSATNVTLMSCIIPVFPEVKGCPLLAVQEQADAAAPEERGPEVEDKTLEELRRLGKDLQAIRLQVDQQLTGNQSEEEWLQVGFIIDRLLFIFYLIFIAVSFITIIGIWANHYAADMALQHTGVLVQ